MPAQIACPVCHHKIYLWSEEEDAAAVPCPRCGSSIEISTSTAIRKGVDRAASEKECPACGKYIERLLRVCPYCNEEFGPEMAAPRVPVDVETKPWDTMTDRQAIRIFFGVVGFLVGIYLIVMLTVPAGPDGEFWLGASVVAMLFAFVGLLLIYHQTNDKGKTILIVIVFRTLELIGIFFILSFLIVVVFGLAFLVFVAVVCSVSGTTC